MTDKIKTTANDYLKRVGITRAKLSREESLRCGFIFGLWTFYNHTDVIELDFLQKCFKKIGLNPTDIVEASNTYEKHKKVIDTLETERNNLDIWFDIGFWTFVYTRALGYDNFAADTETARSLIRTDETIRKAGSNLIEALIKVGWSPDKIEKFNLEKFIPFLHEGDLRKWVENPNMAVMSDLCYEARTIDKENNSDNRENRIISAL